MFLITVLCFNYVVHSVVTHVSCTLVIRFIFKDFITKLIRVTGILTEEHLLDYFVLVDRAILPNNWEDFLDLYLTRRLTNLGTEVLKKSLGRYF